MPWLFAFIGLIFGLGCAGAGEWALGLFGGTLIGALCGLWMSLRDRINGLEREIRELRSARDQDRTAAHATAQSSAPVAVVRPAAASTPVATDTAPAPVSAVVPAPVSTPAPPPIPNRAVFQVPAMDEPLPTPIPIAATSAASETAKPDAEAATATSAPARAAPPPLPQRSAPLRSKPESETSALARWLFESSWITKIGIGIVLIGVGAFLRYAAIEGWFDFPIEMRLVGISVVALAALALGWRKRNEKRIFALNLQGGAIGVLMMVVFASYRIYHLIESIPTFAMLVVLVAGCSLLAIRQNALGLAVFGVIGGFAAPIVASTGSGNHIALFGFYTVLNLGILAMSYARGWRVLNSLGFLFTFVIGTMWGVTRYRPEDFASTEPFLILFFLMYLAIPLLPALRNIDPSRRDHVAGSLVFGTPLAVFALQSAMLRNDQTLLALSALVMAAIYLGLALYVWKHHQLARWKAAYAGLALIFVTLVFPLAFTSGTTTVLWAIEGALLVWIGLAQNERRLRWAGIALQLFAGFALLDVGKPLIDAPLVVNPTTLGALAIAVAALYSAWRYTLAHASHPLIGALAAYGYFAWYVGGISEVERAINGPHETAAVLVFVALTGLVAALLRPLSGLRAFSWPGIALLWSLPMFIAMTADASGSPLSAQGAWVWPLTGFCAFIVLRWLREPWPRGLGWAHVIAWLSLPLLFAFELHARSGMYPQIADSMLSGLGSDWRFVLTTAPFLLAFAALLSRREFVGAPLQEEFPSYRERALWPLAFAAVAYTLIACVLAGNTPPISYVPLLNPLELSQVAVLLLLVRFTQRELLLANDDPFKVMIALLAFVALSAAVLRGVHHLGNEAWTLDMLTRPKAHAALSWTWTLVGAAAMGFGAKRRVRGAWIAGAMLLGIVVAKLLLIDMRFLGTLSGIVSVLGVGVLFVALGYFAPMPPRDEETPT